MLTDTLVILAGGRGTRFIEETEITPKPMITIGGIPIILHIMRYYSKFKVNNFIICGGYKIEKIKEYFLNFNYFNNDIYLDCKKKIINLLKNDFLDWKISIIDTGINSDTGGRLLAVKKYLVNKENFFFTYGDGLSNINLRKLEKLHFKQKKIATISAIRPTPRFGSLKIQKNVVTSFDEKKLESENFVNGGFAIFNKNIFNFIKGKRTNLEKITLPKLSKKKELIAYKHHGFWQSMDTQRDRIYLENVWKKSAPWKK